MAAACSCRPVQARRHCLHPCLRLHHPEPVERYRQPPDPRCYCFFSWLFRTSQDVPDPRPPCRRRCCCFAERGGGLFPTSILYSLSGPCWALSVGLLPAILLSVLEMTLFALSLADCTVAAVGAGRLGAFRRSLLLLSILDSLAAAAAKDDPAQCKINF
jgi:hypothetical protein